MEYKVISTQETRVVHNSPSSQKEILAVRVEYTEGDFYNETTFELAIESTDAEIEQKIIEHGQMLKTQINERSFNKEGTI